MLHESVEFIHVENFQIHSPCCNNIDIAFLSAKKSLSCVAGQSAFPQAVIWYLKSPLDTVDAHNRPAKILHCQTCHTPDKGKSGETIQKVVRFNFFS